MKALALVFLLFAASPIVIDTSELADGQSESRSGGSRRVHVTRNGDTVIVEVAEGKRVDTITMVRKEGQVTISRKNNGQKRAMIGLDRTPVIVDGIDLESFLAANDQGAPRTIPAPELEPPQPRRGDRRNAGPRYYVCPKDETMVRVPAGRGPAELLCPLDGTPMKAGTGADSQIWLLD